MFDVGKTKFQELRDKRLPVALKKVALLGNLGRAPYTSSEAERRDVIQALQEAVDVLKVKYGYQGVQEPERKPTRVPEGVAHGGAEFEAEVRWALDAIRRGDTELAANRLRRCLSDG